MPTPTDTGTVREGCATKFTPGPWIGDLHHLSKYGARDYAFIYDTSQNTIAAAIVGTEGYIDEQGRANVRLIAATPDLYAALERLTRKYMNSIAAYGNDLKAVSEDLAPFYAALRRARGETP